MNEFYTVDEAAAMLRVTPTTIRRSLRAGKIKGIKLAGTRSEWRINKAAFDAYCGNENTSEQISKEDRDKFMELAAKFAGRN